MIELAPDDVTGAAAIEVKAYWDTAEKYVVLNDVDMVAGGDYLKKIKDYLTRLSVRRTLLVKPLNDHVKMINQQFRPLEETARDTARIIERKLAEYNTAQAPKRQFEADANHLKQVAELEKAKAHCEEIGAAEQAAKVAVELEDKIFAPVQAQRTFSGATAKTTFVKRWVFEIVAGDEVPREYCEPDSKKIRAAVKDGKRDIHGVRIWEDTQVQSR